MPNRFNISSQTTMVAIDATAPPSAETATVTTLRALANVSELLSPN
jgi:hypothetical protein